MRSRDRLAELRNLADEGVVYNDTVELYVGDDKRDNAEIEQIFEEVDQMRCWIHEINGNTQLMRRLYSDPTYHNNKHLQDQLDSAITKSNAIGLKVCGALRQFESRATNEKRFDVATRLARLQYAATRHLYAEALTRHEELLHKIKQGQFELLQEQMRLTNFVVSDEECESLLESKNISLFVNNIQAETSAARQVLREVESRHLQLQRVEDSLKDVRDLFLQMAHLVAQQQDLVDTVEYYANQATVHVEYGGQQLLKGSVSQRKARKKKVSLIICLVAGFLLVLLVLIVT